MLLASPNSVEDLLQDVWVAIYRGLPTLLDVAKFRPWAFRIARDPVYREFRRRKLPIDSIEEIGGDVLPEPTEVNLRVDKEELRTCLDLLSPGHREALILRYFEEMSYEEIARVTGSALGTVRSRLHHAKRAERVAVEQTLYEYKP